MVEALRYHAGQIAVQEEARTRIVADKLAGWHGPIAEFASEADVILLATADGQGALRVATLWGPPPLAEATADGALRLAFPAGGPAPDGGPCGGLVVNFEAARRARVNGLLRAGDGMLIIEPTETFTLCKKYVAPSVATEPVVASGPAGRTAMWLDDPACAALFARAETVFLLSFAPGGGPDVAHRGGPPGFVTLDAEAGTVRWAEFLGDGVFKSAGNVRATGRFTLFVPDLDTGDGLEFICRDATYTNTRGARFDREDALIQHRESFPVQGYIEAKVERIDRLEAVYPRRARIAAIKKVTSRSTIPAQSPL